MTVRGLLTWLMVLGVFAGISSRVLAIGHSHEHDHDHASEHGSPCHGHDEPDHDEPDHDEPAGDCPSGCPPGDHHHHFCCGSLQLAVDATAGCRLPVPVSFLVGLQLLNLVPPDGPVFDLDKPPLI